MFFQTTWLRAALLPLALGSLVVACGDNPVDPHDSEHAEAFGLRLNLNGEVVYRYDAVDGTASCDTPPCEIRVAPGAQTDRIEVVLEDRNGDLISMDDLSPSFTLRAFVADTLIASAVLVSNETSYGIRIAGRAPGITRMRVALNHEGEHEDLSTPHFEAEGAIVVRVSE